MKREERPWLPPEKQVQPPEGGWEGFRYWLKNVFWYHYRVATLVGLAALVMTFFFVRDMLNKVEPDYVYTVISPGFVSQDILTECTELVGEVVGDQNGDGQVYIECSALALEEGTELGMANRMKMMIDYQRDEISLFIVHEENLGQMLEANFLTELSAFDVGLEGLTARVDETPIFVRTGLTGPMYAGVRIPKEGKDQRHQQELAARVIRALLDAP